MNINKQDAFALLAAFLVLFSAMLDARVTMILAGAFLVGYVIYLLSRGRRA
jgi:Ca2+/Na+ antiporter